MRNLGSVVAVLLIVGGLWLIFQPKEAKLPHVTLSAITEVKASPVANPNSNSLPARVPMQERNPKDWIEQLPTKSDMQQLSDSEVHSVPAVVADAAEELTAYAEIVRNSPNLRPEALGFFKGCAEKDSVVDSLRAYCFAKAVTLQLELEGRVWDPMSVPANIKELATQL